MVERDGISEDFKKGVIMGAMRALDRMQDLIIAAVEELKAAAEQLQEADAPPTD